MNIYKIIIFIFLFHNACTSHYLRDRGRDFGDIFTAGVENPAYGGGFRLGPLSLGIFFEGGETALGKRDKGEGVGLRGGYAGKYKSQQLIFGFLGGETFYPGEPELDEKGYPVLENGVPAVKTKRENLKSHKLRYIAFYNDPPKERQKRTKLEVRKKITKKLLDENPDPRLIAFTPKENPKSNGYPALYLFQTEIALGAYYGFRIGFNFAEFADFFLGIFTIDILDDDLSSEDEESSGSQ